MTTMLNQFKNYLNCHGQLEQVCISNDKSQANKPMVCILVSFYEHANLYNLSEEKEKFKFGKPNCLWLTFRFFLAFFAVAPDWSWERLVSVTEAEEADIRLAVSAREVLSWEH